MKTDMERIAVIETKVTNIEKTNEEQNCMLRNIKTSVDTFTQWAKQKDKTDDRQDNDIKNLTNNKADKKDTDQIKNMLIGLYIFFVTTVVGAIIAKLIGWI